MWRSPALTGVAKNSVTILARVIATEPRENQGTNLFKVAMKLYAQYFESQEPPLVIILARGVFNETMPSVT
jgi:hypothetical protein